MCDSHSAPAGHLYTLEGKKKEVTHLKIQRKVMLSLYFNALK